MGRAMSSGLMGRAMSSGLMGRAMSSGLMGRAMSSGLMGRAMSFGRAQRHHPEGGMTARDGSLGGAAWQTRARATARWW